MPVWLLISLLSLIDSGLPEDGHIRWSYSPVKKSETEYELIFTASIDRGWHLYSHKLKKGGPMPTTFEFDNNDAIRLRGAVMETGDAKRVFDSTFVMNVVWYENQVVFSQKVKVKSKTKVTGEIRYSVCSEERCIPGSARFSIDLDK